MALGDIVRDPDTRQEARVIWDGVRDGKGSDLLIGIVQTHPRDVAYGGRRGDRTRPQRPLLNRLPR